MNYWIPQDTNDITTVRRVLDSVDAAARLGHRVTVKCERHGLTFEVEEGQMPLRECAKDPKYKIRDSRADACYHGGDEDGHPITVPDAGPA